MGLFKGISIQGACVTFSQDIQCFRGMKWLLGVHIVVRISLFSGP
jgi:hypothetical protein